jgi:hypothetical protein
MSVTVNQNTIYKGNDWWQWSVWIEGDDRELDQLEYVVYTLHPSFPQPIQKISNRSTKFRLSASGWGSFMIFIEIKYKDQRIEKTEHWLKLEYPSGGKNATVEQSGKRLTLYISSGVADQHFARALRDELQNIGITVVMLDDQIADLPFEVSLNSLLDEVTHAAIIISNRPSPWVSREIEVIKKLEAMHKREIPIIPVILGQKIEVPKTLSSYKAIHLNDPENEEASLKEAILQIKKLTDG